uniref:Uncharacterized protein n=1 Tax=Chelonoidis abingdonii TaxID=106734 RepID=A0A8C0ILU9_CHEAB
MPVQSHGGTEKQAPHVFKSFLGLQPHASSGSTLTLSRLCSVAGMVQAMLPDSQKILKNELEIIKSQLHAQAKAFEALSHSVSLLEQESSLQQRKIQQLEGETQFSPRRSRISQQRALQTRGLSPVIGLWRKKFLWEELESVQGEMRRIHQKLKDQEDDITKNLVSIKKMHENQVKCRKILSQLKGKGPGAEGAPEFVGGGRDGRPGRSLLLGKGLRSSRPPIPLHAELSWSPPSVLCTPFSGLSLQPLGVSTDSQGRAPPTEPPLTAQHPPVPPWGSGVSTD